jgi:hypothetical protein
MPTLTPSTPQPSKVVKGHARAFLDVVVPATDTPLVLNADGSPDLLTSPNAFYVGGTKAGYKASFPVSVTKHMMDELRSPYRIDTNGEEAIVEFESLEYDYANLAKMIPTATKSAVTGGTLIKGGGLVTITSRSLLVVSAQVADPTKFDALLIYNAYNSNGLVISWNSKDDSGNPQKWEGLAVPGRPRGDQLYHLFHQE